MILQKLLFSKLNKSLISEAKTMLNCKNVVSKPICEKMMHPEFLKSNVPMDTFCKVTNMPENLKYSQKCIEALRSDKPYELACLVDEKSGKCFGEYAGDAKSCIIDAKCSSSPMILYHGHPPVHDSISLPVSLQDFLVMNSSSINKVVAYNIKGEKSFLRKTPEFKQLSKIQIIKLKESFMKYFIDNIDSVEKDKIKSLIEFCNINKDSEAIKSEIAHILNQLQKNPESSKIIDSFWRKNADSLCLTYFSDFT